MKQWSELSPTHFGLTFDTLFPLTRLSHFNWGLIYVEPVYLFFFICTFLYMSDKEVTLVSKAFLRWNLTINIFIFESTEYAPFPDKSHLLFVAYAAWVKVCQHTTFFCNMHARTSGPLELGDAANICLKAPQSKSESHFSIYTTNPLPTAHMHHRRWASKWPVFQYKQPSAQMHLCWIRKDGTGV